MFRFIKQPNKSFTLIELLIVIAILALLMSIIIITLNPSELLKQTRDTKRISNLKSIDNALGIFQATRPTASTGTSNTVYISIPDSSATCANLGLPALPSGYAYACSTSANYRKTNGTGWIPVNFDSLDIGSPISSLPVDPTNTTSTNLFFTYITGGSWELNAVMESDKSKLSGSNDKTSLDGGDSYSTYEIGTDLSLSPYKDTGLLAYWKFDDGVGTTALDSSGYNNTGTLTNGPTWKTQSDCKRGGCLYFDGTDDYVSTSCALSTNDGESLTISIWNKFTTNNNRDALMGSASGTLFIVHYPLSESNRFMSRLYDGSSYVSLYSATPQSEPTEWNNVIYVYDRATTDKIYVYVNGIFNNQIDIPVGFGNPSNNGTVSFAGPFNSWYFDGFIDDARVYNRALSASEIKVLYEGTK